MNTYETQYFEDRSALETSIKKLLEQQLESPTDFAEGQKELDEISNSIQWSSEISAECTFEPDCYRASGTAHFSTPEEFKDAQDASNIYSLSHAESEFDICFDTDFDCGEFEIEDSAEIKVFIHGLREGASPEAKERVAKAKRAEQKEKLEQKVVALQKEVREAIEALTAFVKEEK